MKGESIRVENTLMIKTLETRRDSSQVLIIDGVRQQFTAEVLVHVTAYQQNSNVVFVSSLGMDIPEEMMQFHFDEPYMMHSWTLEQYETACEDTIE